MLLPVPSFNGSCWRKASHSLASGECIEAASSDSPGYVGVRDSKDPDGTTLIYTGCEWQSFISGIKL
jgi:Domain of unknown function (DUF397)